jgi:hypothetical protein
VRQIGWKDSKISSLLEMSDRRKTGKATCIVLHAGYGQEITYECGSYSQHRKNDAWNFDEVKFFSKSVLYLQQLKGCKFRNDDLKILGF